MDAVASPVGILSFGLDACQGILKYYKSFRDSDEHVKAMYAGVEALAKILAVLATIIKESMASNALKAEVASLIDTGINSCSVPLTHLRKKLDHVTMKEHQAGLKAINKRLQYPFRESTLIKIKDLVNDAQDHLKLSLEVLQMYV